MNNKPLGSSSNGLSRRFFLQSMGIGAVGLGLHQLGCTSLKHQAGGITTADGTVIPGFEKHWGGEFKDYVPLSSERKVKVGIAGFGLCEFGAAFSFQDHPNVEVVAVTDLFPDRCKKMAEACRVSKTYPSLEEMVKDDNIEAVFVATDAPGHARHCIEVLNHGKHVAVAVPAVFGSLEDADELFETVKRTGLKYMMYETSAYHAAMHAMRQIHDAGGFGRVLYSQGEYYHYMADPLPGYQNWRDGLPPFYYITHATAYYVCATNGSFTEVSAMGIPSLCEHLQPENNRYKNPFGTETALFRTDNGGMSRMNVSWDTIGWGAESGHLRGEKGSFMCLDYNKYGSYYYADDGCMQEGFHTLDGGFDGFDVNALDLRRTGLPPGVDPGYHGGSHGPLTHEFVSAIIEDRKPLVDIAMALNMTVPGIVAHQSAMKDGELLKIPQYKW